MKGSLFPNQVLTDHSALRYVELSNAEEILRGRVDWTSRGVYSGFDITINGADNTKIDVAQGSGFAPNGEFVSTTSNYFSIALDDYAVSAINYVCAVYTETNTYSQPHESDGSTYATRAEMAWRIRVYEETAYNALPLTDANLANDARDRMIVLGKVSANGTGNPITTSDITSPTLYSNVLYATPSELVTITGVTVMSVSSGTSVGDGTLTWTVATGMFQWTPAVGGIGPTVNVTADGYYNFTDAGGEYIRCYIVFSQLPVANQSETIRITNLYYQAIPRLTGEDTYHRNLLGTGVVSPTNAHGLSISDLAGDALPQLEEHQDVMHCNGIWRGSSSGLLLTSVITTPPTADTLNIQAPAAGDLYYINGNKLSTISASSIPFASYAWPAGYNLRSNFFEIYLNDQGDPLAWLKASYPSSRNIRGTWIVDMSTSYPAGNYDLEYRTDATYTYLQWDGGVEVAILNTDFGTTNSRVIRLFDAYGDNWIDLWVNTADAKHASNDDDFNSTTPGPVVDSIEVTTSPDWDANMQIASVCYWYDAVSAKGHLGYDPNSVLRRTIDKRPFGTLCVNEMADEALQTIAYHPQDEMHHSGVLLNRNGLDVEFRFVVSPPVGLALDIAGGSFYCRGKRVDADRQTVALVDNTTNLVWCDKDGNYQVIDVGAAPYSGSLRDALRYVIGASSYIPAVDDDTHDTDNVDPPERGVALWYCVTSGAAVSYTESMMRNVNGPVDPWSVGMRDVPSGSSASLGSLAAFETLFAAFAYAEVANMTINNVRERSNIDITVTGYTRIENQRVVQPVGVDVNGSARAYGFVVVQYADLAGAWCLSNGNRIHDLRIIVDVNDTTVFGLATAAVGGSDNVTIDGCVCTYTGSYNCNFISLYEFGFGGSEVKDLTVKDNDIEIRRAFITYPSAPVDYYNLEISGNTVETWETGGAIYGYGVINLLRTYTAHIVNNKLVVNSSAETDYRGINVSGEDYTISGNVIYMGDSGGAPGEVGIYAANLDNSTIQGNVVRKVSGSSSTIGTGIRTSALAQVSICENKIWGLGNGIYDGGTFDSSYLNICNNIIEALASADNTSGVGIFTRCSSVLINNNDVTANSVGIACMDPALPLYAKISNNKVEVSTTYTNPLSTLSIGLAAGGYCIAVENGADNISVDGNDLYITGPGSQVLADSACIYIRDSSRVTVQSCKTTAIVDTLSGGSAYHIYVRNCSDYSIKNCHVDNRTQIGVASSPMHGIYVYVPTANDLGHINGNFMDGSNATGPPYELYINAVTGFAVYGNNVIADITAAGTPATFFAGGAITSVGAPATPNNTLINNTGFFGNV